MSYIHVKTFSIHEKLLRHGSPRILFECEYSKDLESLIKNSASRSFIQGNLLKSEIQMVLTIKCGPLAGSEIQSDNGLLDASGKFYSAEDFTWASMTLSSEINFDIWQQLKADVLNFKVVGLTFEIAEMAIAGIVKEEDHYEAKLSARLGGYSLRPHTHS